MLFRKSDKAAADEEYTEYVRATMDRWRRVAYLMAGDWDRGDDVLQQVLTELYRKWNRARQAESVDALVRTMLMRRFIDGQRLGWARVRLGTELPERAATEGMDLTDRLDLMTALRQVAPRQRAVLVLRYLHDLSVEETAKALNCSIGTVKSQTVKGLEKMRRLLPSPVSTR
ncbi:SigE family RNA polymerase sigma factor [Micromonospora polyrhachis]|uniref:RNA polymerase sigma-70 factor (Sigma-E family) n=1 Tax=Micromonospora polyrhachis TaxID=1282883 RepID=A0A7W7WPB1_9ACTN|nr:SigE family RNA polymerase sigma factor [Micromonospora polyrhachis]MBB4958397.1 RNA polymerase sigma-70 factor (sigma-E family) [Micromonospora polyrhachis]